MNARGGNYLDRQNGLGYSSVSKNNYGGYIGSAYPNRNIQSPQDHNYGEIQFMLQNQRKKFKEAKQKFQYDLDNERKLRIQFENKLIKLKDQLSKNQITISELQFKLNNLLHQNQELVIENDRLKAQLMRLQDLYGNKVHQLETQLALETRNFEQTTIQYNNEFQKFKKQGQEYVEQLNFEHERKIKNLQERLRIVEMARRDLELEKKKLNDILISNKLDYEEQLRDLKNRARQEQMRKAAGIAKSYQQKIKMLQDAKQMLRRKNQQLLRALQDKERIIQDLQTDHSDNFSKLQQDNVDLQNQINHLNHIIAKLRSQLSDKDAMMGRTHGDNDSQLYNLRHQLQQKKQEVNQLSNIVRQLRLALKDQQMQFERRKRELSERLSIAQSDARKYKEQYVRICELLKSKINETINNVSHPSYRR